MLNMDIHTVRNFETAALPGKMLLIRINENNEIDACFRAG